MFWIGLKVYPIISIQKHSQIFLSIPLEVFLGPPAVIPVRIPTMINIVEYLEHISNNHVGGSIRTIQKKLLKKYLNDTQEDVRKIILMEIKKSDKIFLTRLWKIFQKKPLETFSNQLPQQYLKTIPV